VRLQKEDTLLDFVACIAWRTFRKYFESPPRVSEMAARSLNSLKVEGIVLRNLFRVVGENAKGEALKSDAFDNCRSERLCKLCARL